MFERIIKFDKGGDPRSFMNTFQHAYGIEEMQRVAPHTYHVRSKIPLPDKLRRIGVRLENYTPPKEQADPREQTEQPSTQLPS